MPVTLNSIRSRKTGRRSRSTRTATRTRSRPTPPSAATRRSSSGGETSPRGRSSPSCRRSPGCPSRRRACVSAVTSPAIAPSASAAPPSASHVISPRSAATNANGSEKTDTNPAWAWKKTKNGAVHVRCPAPPQLLVAPVLLLAGEAGEQVRPEPHAPDRPRARRRAPGEASSRPRAGRRRWPCRRSREAHATST